MLQIYFTYGGTPLKKKLMICLVFVLISTSIIIVEAENLEPKTIYVDDIPGEGPNNPPEDFTNIQDAINASNKGDIIFVYGGTYSAYIEIDKSIALWGDSNEPAILVSNEYFEKILIHANDVSFFNFKVITESEGNGQIHIFKSNNVEIINNTFKNNDNSIKLDQSDYNMLLCNTCIGNNKGTSIDLYESCNNKIEYNEIKNNFYAGINIFLNSQSNTIKNNTISNIDNYGISIWNSSNNKVESNTITYCERGIDSSEGENTLFTNNSLNHNGWGLYICSYNKNNIIKNNNIYNNSHVAILFDHSDGEIKRNNIINNWCDFFIVGKEKITITENNLLNRKSNIQFVKPNNVNWNGNYWENWQFNSPKPILGIRFLPIQIPIPYPVIDFDMNPAAEPYELM